MTKEHIIAEANFDEAAILNTLPNNDAYLSTPSQLIHESNQSGKGGVLAPGLTHDGVRVTDNVFTGRSKGNSDFLSATSGTVAAKATGDPGRGITYRISEKLI